MAEFQVFLDHFLLYDASFKSQYSELVSKETRCKEDLKKKQAFYGYDSHSQSELESLCNKDHLEFSKFLSREKQAFILVFSSNKATFPKETSIFFL